MAEPTRWADFEAAARQSMSVHDAPAMVAAFARDGELVYGNTFGFADREAGIPATLDTIFGVASVTKSFTALAIMQLADAGRLSVNDPVVRYLPEFRLPDAEATKTVTLEHLLVHTSSLPPLPTLGWAIAPSQKDDPLVRELRAEADEAEQEHPTIADTGDLLRYIAEGKFEPTGRPGEMFSYSNDAYALLGLVIERVSGVPYAQYVVDHILVPLGMTRSTFDLGQVMQLGNVATLYARDKSDAVRRSPVWQEFQAFAACGQLRSTVSDLLKYASMYAAGGLAADGRRIVSAAAVREMAKPRYNYARDAWYGYGLMIRRDYHGVTLVGHGGSLKGVASFFGFVPEKGLAGAVIFNLVGSPSQRTWVEGINTMMGLPVSERWTVEPEYAASPEALAGYTGTFASGEGAKVDIRLTDARLTVDFGDGQLLPARPSGPDTVVYRLRDMDGEIRLFRDAQGMNYAIHMGLRFMRAAQPAEGK